MEPEAKYTLVGGSVLALLALVVAAVAWLASASRGADVQRYTIYFARQSLEGLQVHPERMRENLDPVLVDELPEPGGELGSAGVFVDRALERYRREVT